MRLSAYPICGKVSTRVASIDLSKEFPYIGIKEITWAEMITSKLTSKAQTTIPASIRAALRLKEGDELAYSIENDHVILTKASRAHADDPFAAFDEWSSDADREAYAGL